MDLAWMQWTPVTALLFGAVILSLTLMTVWDIRSPSLSQKGFLPVAFSRGERLFLSIVVFLGICILWLAFLPDVPLEFALPVAAVLIIILVRWG